MLHYNKITEKEGIDKTNGKYCHGKANLKSWKCYYCLNYFFVFKTSNMILIYVMIAIFVNKEKKFLKPPYFV